MFSFPVSRAFVYLPSIFSCVSLGKREAFEPVQPAVRESACVRVHVRVCVCASA